MRNGLIPELRTDANGTTVTRWVRRITPSETGATVIPKVAVTPSQTQLDDEYARCAYERLLDGFSSSREWEIVDLPADPGGRREQRFSNRRTLEEAFRKCDYESISVMDKFGMEHGLHWVHEAVVALREGTTFSDVSHITSEAIMSFKSLSGTIDNALFKAVQSNPQTDELTLYLKLRTFLTHVLQNPDDGPMLEAIVSRGISDISEACDLMDSIREDDESMALVGGHL